MFNIFYLMCSGTWQNSPHTHIYICMFYSVEPAQLWLPRQCKGRASLLTTSSNLEKKWGFDSFQMGKRVDLLPEWSRSKETIDQTSEFVQEVKTRTIRNTQINEPA